VDLTLKQKLEKLIQGQAVFTSQNLGFNLLVSRLQKKYAANRTTSELSGCVQEIMAFLTKYNNIMSGEIEKIKKI
jgi:hypothetical protein